MTGFSRRFGENSAVLADLPLHRLANSPRAAPEAAARLEKEDSSVGQAHMAPRPTSRRPALHLESWHHHGRNPPSGARKRCPLACPQPDARRPFAMAATFEDVEDCQTCFAGSFLMIFRHCVPTWVHRRPQLRRGYY